MDIPYIELTATDRQILNSATLSCWTDWAHIWARATSLCSTAWKAWIILL